ncbi:MAG: hypothetical protein Q4A74_08705, partial [Cardiobacteriaceae bacterium]|nr:hypothetical protein [Cardiobacteriaceae bacterium]
YSKNSISLKPKIVSARMVLKVLHSKEKDDERIGNEFESSIVIYVNFTNNEKSAIVINSTDKTNKIIAENKNPIDSIIPSPPMLQL